MTEYFDWKNHLCIVFELLYINLYELLKHTNFQGVSINLTRKFGIQILQSLAYLKSLDIIHCDLKPENILLKSSKQSIIKIIDFGSSCSLNNKMYSYIQSRFYRSPEVIMGLNYDCAIDMWSLGTILVELHTGIPIFDGRNEMDQLHKIVRVLGIPPKWMIENMPISKRRDYFIFDTSIGNYKLKNVTEMKNISLLDVLTRKDSSTSKFVQNETEKEFLLFVDVIKSMLIYEPQKRVKPNEALNHEFFKNCK